MKELVSRIKTRASVARLNRVRSRTQPCSLREAYPICLRLSPLRSGCVHSCSFASGYLRCAPVVASAARFVLKIPTLIFTNEHKDTLIASAPTQRSCRLLQHSITPLLLCLLAALTPAPAQAEELIPELPEKHFDFLDKYCLECHDALTEKGSVNLEDLAFVISNIEEAELWQKVLNTMNAGEMPPEDKKQPGESEKADFLDALAQTMVDARRSLSDTGGEITMRRLNRREYQNSMASLLGFEVDVSNLPADGGGSTFDTEGASLFISSDQIEQYLKLGRSAVGEWLERRAVIGQPAKLFRLEPEKSVNAKSRKMVQNLEAGKDKFLLWKAEVDKVIDAPENREIMARLLKENPDYDPATFPSGGGLRFYRNASELIGAPDPKDFGYVDDNKAVFSYQSGYNRHYAYQKHFTELPHNDRGAYLRLPSGIQRFDLQPDPQDLPPGTYQLRIQAGTVEGSDPSRHFIEVGHPAYNANGALSDSGFTGPAISSHQVTGTIENPSLIELTIDVGADTPREFGVQESRPRNAKAIMKEYYRFKAENGYGTPPAIWIDWIELEGPLPEAEIPASKTYRVEAEEVINPINERAIKAMEETFDRFARWKKGVDEAAKSPENQAIIAEIAKTEPRILKSFDFYKYADRLKGTPDATEFGFNDAPNANSANPERPNLYAYLKHYAALPHRDTGAYIKPTKGTGRVIVSPEELPIGNYTLRIRVGAVEGSDPSRHFIQVGHPQRMYASAQFDHGFEGRAISTQQVTGTIAEPQIIEVPLEVRPDTIREFSVQEKQPNNGKVQALWKTFNAAKKKNGYGMPPAIWIDWVELEGPHPASHSQTTFTDWWVDPNTTPDDSQRAREIFENFAVTAFRGVAAEDDFLDRLSTIYETRRAAGDSFDQALELPLAVILSSPGFLYFNEPTNDADERRQLNDRELAVRLAYFLWSSPPDEELLSLAQRGELSNPDILRSQVARLIADPRSDEFVAGFLHQWLDMERLDFFQFDTTLYRDFDESTRSAARQEVYESFAYLLRSDEGNLGQLLKSDHVFVNGLLATYYDLEGVTGDQFQKVSLPAGSPRGGLLGMAAIHAMGSDGIESSPVERGAWVLRHLLNDPPPPAPPNVPQLSRLDDEALTTRQKLAAHMEEAQCASCHRKIDPIGFGLENFNAAGKWRTEEGRGRHVHEIDPADQFHNGPKFKDYFELRDIIAGREPDFARGFTEHLIGYGLGRPFGFTDEDLADEIVEAAAAEDYTVSAFVQALVMSEAFGRK